LIIAQRCDLDNANQPQHPSLSEADQAEVEGFLDEMLLCFPVLGVPVFEQPTSNVERQPLLYLRAKGVEARGYESSEGFVVLAGSQACGQEVPSIHDFLRELRQNLISREVLKADGDHYVVGQDYTFNSPSTAAGVLLGRSANGRTEWKDQHGRTLRAIQESAMEEPAELS
jgi:hypothetical protein